MQIQSGKYDFTQAHPAYGLHQGEGPRSVSVHTQYSKPFHMKPKVVSWLSSFAVMTKEDDLDIRVNVDAENDTAQGFELKLTTWRDTQVHSAAASWIAWGTSLPPGAVWGAAALPPIPAAAPGWMPFGGGFGFGFGAPAPAHAHIHFANSDDEGSDSDDEGSGDDDDDERPVAAAAFPPPKYVPSYLCFYCEWHLTVAIVG